MIGKTMKGSPLISVLLGFLLFHSFSVMSSRSDATALLTLKSRVPRELLSSHFITKNWSESWSVCDWKGITCNRRHGRVAVVNLIDTGLQGSLPPELGNLSFLVSLNLGNNTFNGVVPQNWFRLRRLKLMSLPFNQLSGEIPSWIGYLSQLEVINLRNNSFHGLLPNSITNATRLQSLDITSNFINGSIPQDIGNLQELRVLALQYNTFQGVIPSSIFNLSNLRVLSLSHNHLVGHLPENICVTMPRIEILSLFYNKFEGRIPTNCSHLIMLGFPENNMHGSIPYDIDTCPALEFIFFRSNSITGRIPITLGNLTSLRYLDFSFNQLIGTIPENIAYLSRLEAIDFSFNSLTGNIPMGISNISSLFSIQFTSNNLTGKLPTTFGYGLPNLQVFYVSKNGFTGSIPQFISNCSKLYWIGMSQNNFTGTIPDALGELRLLNILSLAGNNLVSESSELSIINALSNCQQLLELHITSNPFYATLPNSIGNLSRILELFSCGHCHLYGPIPTTFGNLSYLQTLDLRVNQMSGSIPSGLNNLQRLQGLYLNVNELSGTIPEELCALQACYEMYLYQNQIIGSIPTCLGNLVALRKLWISNNRLDSTLTETLWNLHDVLELNLSANLLTGSISNNIGNLKQAYLFDLSDNLLSGFIPNSIGDMQKLSTLLLDYNQLEGSIPKSMGNIVSLQMIDFSHNNLSGSIPFELQNIKSLQYFNVSFNNLIGQIPSGGPFKNFTTASFTHNQALCGESQFGVPPCKNASVSYFKRVILPCIIASVGFLTLVLIIMVTYFIWRIGKKKISKTEEEEDLQIIILPIRASYYDLVRATDNFNDINLLGKGGFSSVYKATFPNGDIFAVKVFDIQTIRNFELECEILRNLRHRNLCKVVGVCSNNEFKALIMEFMNNGDLNQWLYSENHSINAKQRLSIMIDIAHALDYLHHGYSTPVAHLDLNPSNILLDIDMIGHLSDFGISKLFDNDNTFYNTKTLATLGYIAPEYASDGLVSTKCDVYSYGIVLMEMFTGKKPNDEVFVENDLTIVSLVSKYWVDEVERIVDSRLVDFNDNMGMNLESFSSIFEVALKCTVQNPMERMLMNDVVVALRNVESCLHRV